MGGGGGGGGSGGGGSGRTGSGHGNLRGPGETNRQRFRRQGDSRIRSNRMRGDSAVQAAFKAGYRGWSVGVNGSWSGGNIGDKNSPSAKAYRSTYGEKAYKSMIKAGNYRGTGLRASTTRNFLGTELNYDPAFSIAEHIKTTFADTLQGFKDTFNPQTSAFNISQWGNPDYRARRDEAIARNQESSHFANQLGAAGLGWVRNVAGLASHIPGMHRPGFQAFMRATDPDKNPNETLGNITKAASLGFGLQNTFQGIQNVRNLAHLPKQSFNIRDPSLATRIGPTRGWWNRGRNLRVPNENQASWSTLGADDVSQIGQFRNAAGGLESGLLGTGLPKNFRQAGQFVRGKGGLTWSATRGVPTGPTASVRQAFERPLRGIRNSTQSVSNDLRRLTNAVRTIAPDKAGMYIGAGIGGGLRGLSSLTSEQVPQDVQIKAGIQGLGYLNDTGIADYLDNSNRWNFPLQGAHSYLLNTLKDKSAPAQEAAQNLRGVRGWYARRQDRRLNKEYAAGDTSAAIDRFTMNLGMMERYGGDIPTVGQWARGKLGQARDVLNNRNIRSVDNVLGQGVNRTRREQVRNLRESGYGTGRGGGGNNRMTVRDFDPNKINIQANPYGQSQAASDESDLAGFWQQQNQLNTAADQRLKDIQGDQSAYTKLIEQLNQQQQGYTDQIAKIQPHGQSLTDELERLKPIGQGMSEELERIRPIGKQYADELERLKPYDEMFRDEFRYHGWGAKRRGLRPAKKGELIDKDVLTGREFIQENAQWHLGTHTPYTTQLLKDYNEYLTGVENLTKWQGEHKTYLSDLEGQYKAHQEYSGGIQTQQKEYQDYLTELQTEQGELNTYATSVGQRSRNLNTYATQFRSAREASDRAARTYTIRSQQGIAGAFRPGVSGIRSARGYTTMGSNRNRSAKRRFNRDFRIGSFGDTSMSPINV